jgi:RNase P subunit RPR2
MPSNLLPSEWEALSRVLQQTIEAWRQAHPTATLDEIESIIDTHLAPLRAKLVEATAQASHRQDWQSLEPAKQPSCATCGAPLVARGQHRRRLQTTGGASVELERTYGVCPICGQGLFPPR